MDLNAFFSDPRRRNIAILAALALISTVLAIFALNERAAEVAPKYTPQAFFPGFAGDLNKAAHIHIVSKKNGAFDVTFKPEKGWVLPGRSNYPASFEEVRKTLVGLAALQTIEPKTSRTDWFHYVDLDAPPKGNGVLITVSDDQNHTLASLIVGKSEDTDDASDFVDLFARKPNDSQSWLVKSPFQPQASQTDWMSKKVVDVDNSRIQEADIHPLSGPGYTVKRDKPSDTDFTLSPIPRGRVLVDPGAPDDVANALAGFSFDDVEPSANFDFDTQSSRLVTRTFDGLIVSVDVIKQGGDYWARVFADAVPGKPEAAKEAHEINARAAGWAYKLPAYKGAQFLTSLDSLLKPVGKAKGSK
ncbi:MAG: DUF4340 domain-containing protein [Alphaproteobacteria bacterium]|nr:DUF4340 domain-containing protein [Alphaproteobacteria bacterium]MDE2498632.1 DUF4340 domain-containing protein [Alphaproteobacteria bacterium]